MAEPIMSENRTEEEADERQEHKGERRRKERVSRRRRQVKRGKCFVLAALTASVLFYIAAFVVVLTDIRFFYDDLVALISASILVGIAGILGTVFAVATYRGNEVFRQLFVILNLIGGIVGTISLVVRYAQERTDVWMLMDLAGVIIAFSVCGALFLSRGGVMFLDEQNLRRR